MDDAVPRFARRPPSPDLAPWIVCYWSLGATGAPRFKSRVLPDGSNDLIVDLSGKTRPFVVGAMPQAEVVTLQGRVDLLGVRFHPGGALPFLHHPLNELTGREVELDALWGRAAGSLADAVAAEPPAGQRIEHLERVLRDALQRRWEESLVTRAVACYHRAHGAISVRQVASALGVGERRLERAFARCVGLSPKQLARVLRFLHTVRHMGRTRWAGAPLALDAGYADQSHFIREFKALAGVTPTAFVAERRTGIVQDENAAHR
jgi:AraC-like DNA-binding protein